MQNFRNKIEKTVFVIANNLQHKGIFKTIQIILYGENKNIAPRETRW